MKNIEFFTTENGVASLTLREIPYQGCAYVRLQDSREPAALLQECVDFCRACGADHIYAAGHSVAEDYPLYTAICRMRCDPSALPETDALVWPVQKETLPHWLEIYHNKIKRIPNGAWMTASDAEKMLAAGEGYFIHRQGKLLGTGRVCGGRIDWVASVQPGAGREIGAALGRISGADVLELTVASANTKAVSLYESLGFVPIEELSRWYKII